MQTTYAILEDGQPLDGEFLTREDAMRLSFYAEHGSRIVSFDLAELFRDGATSMRDVTEEIVFAAKDAGIYDDEERAEDHLPGDFINFGIHGAEDRAERQFDEARDHRAMGWV